MTHHYLDFEPLQTVGNGDRLTVVACWLDPFDAVAMVCGGCGWRLRLLTPADLDLPSFASFCGIPEDSPFDRLSEEFSIAHAAAMVPEVADLQAPAEPLATVGEYATV